MKLEKFIQRRYNSRQLEKKLGLSRTTLWRARKAGLINAVRIGRFLWYEEEEVEKFIKRQKENNGAQLNAA
jgi:predicted DNA-binding transcriptional regulator AlpA